MKPDDAPATRHSESSPIELLAATDDLCAVLEHWHGADEKCETCIAVRRYVAARENWSDPRRVRSDRAGKI